VSVSGLKVETPGTITFRVEWSTPMPAPITDWSDSVWVFVDYNKAGNLIRLPLVAGGATLTWSTADGTAQVIEAPGNTRGVWVYGNARTAGNFSANVRLLTSEPSVSGACVYASNYPPTGTQETSGITRFTGSSPYELTFLDGSTATVVCPLGTSCTYNVGAAATVTAFTDATGAPGIYTVNTTPLEPTVTGGSRCGSGTVTLTASAPGATLIEWFTVPTGGVRVWTGGTFTPTVGATTTFYVQATYGSGLTSNRVPVTATLDLYEGEIAAEEI
jgi:hypothetical protein